MVNELARTATFITELGNNFMDHNSFKKLFHNVMMANGLFKKGSCYYAVNPGVIISVGLQKSGYSKAYYINIGYLLPYLQGDCRKLKYTDGSVRTRFFSIPDNETVDIFDLGSYGNDHKNLPTRILQQNINKYILPVKSVDDLKLFVHKNPVLLYQTTLAAKKYLGFEY
jgi:hypothetical protein